MHVNSFHIIHEEPNFKPFSGDISHLANEPVCGCPAGEIAPDLSPECAGPVAVTLVSARAHADHLAFCSKGHSIPAGGIDRLPAGVVQHADEEPPMVFGMEHIGCSVDM